MNICLIIPCYNEAKRLDKSAYEKFLNNCGENITLLFVNDGSVDQTVSVLNENFSNFSNVEILDLKENMGKALAVRSGFIHRLKNNNDDDYIGFWDADLATPFDQIELFKSQLENGTSIVLGSRINKLGSRVERKWYRHYLGRAFATFASIALGLSVYDTQCGAKMFKRDICEGLFSEPFHSKWIFDIEIFFRAKKMNLHEKDFCEVPLLAWKDVGGSSLKTTDFFKAPLELLNLVRRYK